MGKNQSASGLTNIVQYDNNGNISFVSGSTTLMQISSSGAITTTGVISGSNALSSSYALNSGLLNSTGSVGFATTGSLLIISSSQQQISASQQQLSSSFLILTASFNAVSASQQQISASYIALSASYNTFSGSASTRITVDSASLLQVSASQQQISASLLNVISIFATTGSNSFRATQSITGSLTVTGQIIAQTLNVQQVTSSIIYSSGSNNFGCDLNSRQTFTGSVLITGSLTIAGASSATSYSGTTIYGSTVVCSPVGKFTSCIDAGSGTFSGNLTTNSGVNYFNGTSDSVLYYQIGSTTGGHMYLTSTKLEFSAYSTRNMLFETNGTTKMFISGSGNVGIGTTSPAYLLDVNGTGRFGGSITSLINTAGVQNQLILENLNTAAGADGNSIYFKGYQGSLAKISAVGIPTQQVGGYLQLQSYSDNTTANIGLIINQNGNVSINNTNNSYQLDVSGTLRVTGAATFACSLALGNQEDIVSTIGLKLGYDQSSIEMIASSYANGYGAKIEQLDPSDGSTYTVLYGRANTTCWTQNFKVNNSNAAATFSSTITGTTIYGSTAVCSAIGKFTTCLDLGGALTGTTALFNLSANSTLALTSAGTNASMVKAGSGDELYIGGNDTWQMRFNSGNILMDNGGCVGIGTSTPSAKLNIYGTAGDGSVTPQETLLSIGGNELGNSGGYNGIRLGGTQTSSYGVYIRGVKQGNYGSYWDTALTFSVTRTSTTTTIDEVMRITSGAITCFAGTVCAPCFATISDYRMKSNIRPIAGLSIIMNTKPYKFEYNYDCSTSFGMIAHELQDTLPEAVFGQKDGETMQGVDYMKLLPIAIKAIQEQQCKIALLESCLGIA